MPFVFVVNRMVIEHVLRIVVFPQVSGYMSTLACLVSCYRFSHENQGVTSITKRASSHETAEFVSARQIKGPAPNNESYLPKQSRLVM